MKNIKRIIALTAVSGILSFGLMSYTSSNDCESSCTKTCSTEISTCSSCNTCCAD